MSTALMKLTVHTDGASRQNPGHAACSFVVLADGTATLKVHREYLGDQVTNNQAEYCGMARALAYLVELAISFSGSSFDDISIFSDSKLVVEQINGGWKMKDADLKAPCQECRKHLRTLRERGHKVEIQWIPREQNQRADRLCNQTLNENVRVRRSWSATQQTCALR